MNPVDDESPTSLTFIAESAGSTVKLTKSGSPTVDGLQYRMGTSGGWTPYTINTVLTLTNIGDCVQFQNTLEELSKSTSNYVKFVMSGKIAATGNIMSMLNYIDECKTDCFANLFNGCSSLTTAPTLPATNLAQSCYEYMFYGCRSLTTAPTLPATNLTKWCYQYMFSSCRSLTVAPELPATNLAQSCYSSMFYGCSKLTVAPELPATNLAESCYREMFYGCSSLTKAPELPATTLAPHCYRDMFKECSKLTVAPELPATTLASSCYFGMFHSCSSLTSAPSILPATDLADGCYQYMFLGCTNLTVAPELPATDIDSGCYYSMFQSCTSLTTAPTLPATKLYSFCYTSMFFNCSSLTTAPELPATTLASSCYNDMFNRCTKLKYIKVNFSSWTADTTTNWVAGVSSTGEFDAPSNLPIIFGNSNIPTGWDLTNVSPSIKAEDQSMGFSTIVEKSANIKYKVYPLDSIMTFTLAEDTTLPAGLELNTSTGEIKGISTASEGVYETKIKISAPDCEDVIITLTITISAVASLTTPHNLTSNTSDSRYEVSQSTNLETKRLAWNAMDGAIDEEYGCSHTKQSSNQWWKIKFNEGPVNVTKLTWTNRTGGLGTFLKNPYLLQGSNDDSTWTTVYTINDMVSTSDAVKTWEISDTTKYQYWRILNQGYAYLIIGEIEFEYSL
jgi:hypothetical protein